MYCTLSGCRANTDAGSHPPALYGNIYLRHFEENASMFKSPLPIMKSNGNFMLAIYGPMIYTAPHVMLMTRANPLRGQVGGGGRGFTLARSCMPTNA
jgi:hypothetical protein